jgi:BolA family transcriptional regulator, general stress-responsive regulator
MNGAQKLALIKERINNAFHPTFLEVTDDSDQHVGHAGHGGGGRHFTITITSACFAGKSRVDAHREIYSQFNDLIPHEIHALVIKII